MKQPTVGDVLISGGAMAIIGIALLVGHAHSNEAEIVSDANLVPPPEYREARVYGVRGGLVVCYEPLGGSWLSCFNAKPTSSVRQCRDPGRQKSFQCRTFGGA